MKYENHELADLFPMMDKAEIADMAKDISANGQRNAIVIHEGKILDGRNRYAACKIAGIDPFEIPFKGKDALSFVLSTNLHRRHLTTSQRAMVAAKLANMNHGGDRKGNQVANLPLDLVSQDQAAEKLNVSARIVRDAKAIAKASIELADKVSSGEISVNDAKGQIKASSEGMPFDPDMDLAKENAKHFQKKVKITDDFDVELPAKVVDLWNEREKLKTWIGELQRIRREVANAWESRSKLLAGKKRAPLSFNSFDSQLAASITDMKAAYPRHLCPVCNGDGCDYCAGLGIVSDFNFKFIPEKLQ